MSKPISDQQVKRVRELFDCQAKNSETNPWKQREPIPDKQRAAEIKEELLEIKTVLDSNMERFLANRKHEETLKPAAADETWMRSSDDSFLRWEQDCEQTMYRQPAAPKRAACTTPDPDMVAMENLLREYNLDTSPTSSVPPAAHDQLFDHTQLADIEPPSGIWDTIREATGISPTENRPVRPSTIVEEDTTVTTTTARSSYETAESHQSSFKYTVSERYETANEATMTTIRTASPSSSSLDVIEILDDSYEDKKVVLDERSTLDGISSLPADESYGTSSSTLATRSTDDNHFLDDSLLDSETHPQFNDTLERIEFMEEQGKKLLQQQKTTPLAQKLLLGCGTSLLPSSSASQKKVFYPSPGSVSSQFKKPHVRSPQVKFVPGKRNFDHIKSPIATYIKDVPSNPMLNTYKGQTLFGKTNSPIKPNTPANRKGAEAKENLAQRPQQIQPPVWNIPRRVFTATNNRHIIDHRSPTKIPGGDKIQKIIKPALDDQHKIIRHEGRIKMNMDEANKMQQPRDSIFDESLAANLSMISGDVSIQVAQNMRKN